MVQYLGTRVEHIFESIFDQTVNHPKVPPGDKKTRGAPDTRMS